MTSPQNVTAHLLDTPSCVDAAITTPCATGDADWHEPYFYCVWSGTVGQPPAVTGPSAASARSVVKGGVDFGVQVEVPCPLPDHHDVKGVVRHPMTGYTENVLELSIHHFVPQDADDVFNKSAVAVPYVGVHRGNTILVDVMWPPPPMPPGAPPPPEPPANTVGTSNFEFKTSFVLLGKTVTCDSVAKPTGTSTQCNNFRVNGVVGFRNGYSCDNVWSSYGMGGGADANAFCRYLFGSSQASHWSYFTCGSSTTRSQFSGSSWGSDVNDNGYIQHIQCKL